MDLTDYPNVAQIEVTQLQHLVDEAADFVARQTAAFLQRLLIQRLCTGRSRNMLGVSNMCGNKSVQDGACKRGCRTVLLTIIVCQDQ